MTDISPPVTRSDRYRERWEEWADKQPPLVDLRSELLSIGGNEVVPVWEPDVEALLAAGQVITPTEIVNIEGVPSQCHQNVARLYADHESVTEIGTGWALSSDGLWRQHSWAHRGDELVETTETRDLYYGLLLDGTRAEEFVSKNYY